MAELGVWRPPRGDLVCWPMEGVAFAGALSDPIRAWLAVRAVSARHTVVHGNVLVEDGEAHRRQCRGDARPSRVISARMQGD